MLGELSPDQEQVYHYFPIWIPPDLGGERSVSEIHVMGICLKGVQARKGDGPELRHGLEKEIYLTRPRRPTRHSKKS